MKKIKINYFLLLLISISIYFTVFLILSFLRYKSFMSFEWQCEALRNNLMFNNSHGHFFHTFRPGAGTRHVGLIEFLFLPLYLLFPDMRALYIILTFFIAITAIPIYLLAVNVIKSQKIAFWLSLSFLFWAPVHNINFSRFVWVLIAPFFIVFNYYYFYKKNFKMFCLFALILLLIREDLILYFAFFSIYAFLKEFKQPKWFISSFSLAIFFFVVDFKLIKITTNSMMLIDKFYVPESISTILQRIKSRFLLNLHIFLKLFLPVNFFIFFISEWILTIPALLLILLNRDGTILTPTNIHHLTIAIPTIYIGLIMLLAKIRTNYSLKTTEKIVFFIFLLNTLTIFCPNILGKLISDNGFLPDKRFIKVTNIFSPLFFISDKRDAAAWQIIKLIPKNSSVFCTGDLLPALSNRRDVFEYPFSVEGHEVKQLKFCPEYYMLNINPLFFGAGHTNYDFHYKYNNNYIDIKSIVNTGYSLVTANQGYYLLKKII